MVRSALAELGLPPHPRQRNSARAAVDYAALPMLACTDGQPATPTTVGKEMAVFVVRWERLFSIELEATTGHTHTHTQTDWLLI